MSICTFLASDYPLPQAAPSQEYPIIADVDNATIYDGGADDNFFLHIFDDVQDYTDKAHGVRLEWHYTDGRAEQILNYIKNNLKNTDSIELWHVWLTEYYEYEDSPVIHNRTISVKELTVEDIKEIDNADVFNNPDKRYPNRPSFYRLTINSD